MLRNQGTDFGQVNQGSGELEWVSGWDDILVKKISVPYNETEKALVSHTPLRARLLWAKGQDSGMWANALCLKQEASYEGQWVLCRKCPVVFPIEKEKGSTMEDRYPN